ncbi:hypothetical protein L211DRAFT_833700 [Terfezia boudieri ATCC MYA-4762]|uniref:Uncharacterized protein n=1 Tax=Terfezia boudieri ATCC MYA-4762 TaxID=1051890 RepID=A0A3N4M813_9PEZI|nr:hypothetical protein L211DRAFT_833700 [Terfezia boudieri ATCC MYA-4762]
MDATANQTTSWLVVATAATAVPARPRSRFSVGSVGVLSIACDMSEKVRLTRVLEECHNCTHAKPISTQRARQKAPPAIIENASKNVISGSAECHVLAGVIGQVFYVGCQRDRYRL